MCDHNFKKPYLSEVIFCVSSHMLKTDKITKLQKMIKVMLYHDRKVAEKYIMDHRKQNHEAEGLLLITDDAVFCTEMSTAGIPVIALLNQDNRSDSFEKISYMIEDIDALDVRYMERVYRRYCGIPWIILETDRCILREIMVEDVERIASIYKSDAVNQYIEPLFCPIEREKEYTKQYIENIYSFFEFGMWVVIDKKAGSIMGRAGIEFYEDAGRERIELGYLIAEKYQKQGYGYEVCKAVLWYAEEELEMTEFEAHIALENLPSIRLCRKLGFQYSGKIIKNRKEYNVYQYSKH